MSEFPAYEEMHIISDIHMGGKPGFQILRETRRLANFICRLADQNPERQLALVLNGDVIDTLAEDIAGYVAVENALASVDRILSDKNFSPVWESLMGFVHKEKRSLVIVIGNHDIEIAFPNVQRLLLDRLSDGDGSARSRIHFSTIGAGYTCMVGKARVFCTHGNEVDPWNFNRYEDLSKVARRINTGCTLKPEEWTPNAGTRMVKDVMNEVKRQYAWIDLLKPENSAAIGTLLAMDPSQLVKLNKLPPIVGVKIAGAKQLDHRLSADGLQEPAPSAVPASLEGMLGAHVMEGIRSVGATPEHSGDDMLLALEQGRSAVAHPMGDAPLGIGQLVWDRLTGWLTGVGTDEALRRALQDWLKGDETFAIDDKDDTFKEIVEKLGPSVDFVVTGHTHLERAILFGAGRCYFNSGTWIRLLRFTEAMLANPASFRPVFEVLKNGTMSAIDSTIIAGEPLLLDQTTVISISLESGKTVGRLQHVTGDGSGAPIDVKQLP